MEKLLRLDLAKMILDNPDTEIICMTDSEIVASDDYINWLSQIDSHRIDEYNCELGEERVWFKSDIDEMIDYIEDDEEITTEEATKRAKETKWKRVIVLNIGTP